jgi:hypothetical protein
MSTPRHVSGELVYRAIRDNPGIPSRGDIASVTGLSISQVSAGILWVKEIAAFEHKTPFTWTRLTGYQVSSDFDICHLYEKAQSFTVYNKMKRLLLGTFAPHAANDPQDAWVNKMTRHYEVALDGLATLLQLEPIQWPLVQPNKKR